jgi:hypothetical protein
MTDKDSLVIFGGFDINKKSTNFGCVIEMKEITPDEFSHEEEYQ